MTADDFREIALGLEGVVEPASGAWGRQGWTQIRLDAAGRATARSALVLAWQNINQKPPARPRNRRSRSR